MNSERIRVTVAADGTVSARHFERRVESRPGRLALDGLDSRLVHHFEQWLTLRDRTWLPDEIQTFGLLLHRCLFPAQPYDAWAWIEQQIALSEETVRLTLQFPAGREYAHLTTIPWEYLHSPRGGSGGYFLARHPRLVLSRHAPPPPNAAALKPLESLSVLPVVADPWPARLGPVEADEVLETLRRVLVEPRFRLLPLVQNPDVEQLSRAVAAARPDLVHFMGHGRFDTATMSGALALRDPDPANRYEWVDERRVADALCPRGSAPRVVVLHTCEGGVADSTFRFAGQAPELIGRGVQCVIAMQYPIRNDTASRFSTALYERLAAGMQLDEAFQGCRDALADQLGKDPRLVGIPVLYQSRADPVLTVPAVSMGDES
jgi:hypothetical protein